MPVTSATSSPPRVLSSSPSIERDDHEHERAPSSSLHDAGDAPSSSVWRKVLGASFACVGAGVATSIAASAITPMMTRLPSPVIMRPGDDITPPNVVAPPANGASQGPVIVVVPPSVRPSTPPVVVAPAQPPATHTPAPPQAAPTPAPQTRPTPPPSTPPPTTTTPPHVAPQASGVFAFQPLPGGVKLPVDGTFTTTILFGPTAIRFAGSAQVVKSDENNLVLRINASGVDGIFQGQSRVVQLSFTKIDAKHVRFSAQDLTSGQNNTTSTLTLVSSSASSTKLRAADGSTVLLVDARGSLTITYDQNVINVKHPTTQTPRS